MVEQMSSSTKARSANRYPELAISADELRSKLFKGEGPLMIFDFGDENRYKREHIAGSKFIVCNQETINTMLPKWPKGIDIILVGEDENYTKEMAEMARDKASLQTRYLQGGLAAWDWEKTFHLTQNFCK